MPIFVRDGFTPYIPEWDEGVDFIVYRERDDLLIKIQLKSRWLINRKYIGRRIGMLFSDGNDFKNWYLCPHDEMVSFARDNKKYLESASWNSTRDTRDASIEVGEYHVKKMDRTMEAYFEKYRLSSDRSNDDLFEKFRLNS